MSALWPGSPARYTSSPACCTASSRSLYIYLLLAVQFQLYSPYCSLSCVLPPTLIDQPLLLSCCIYSIYCKYCLPNSFTCSLYSLFCLLSNLPHCQWRFSYHFKYVRGGPGSFGG